MEEFLPHLELLTRIPVIYIHLLAHNRGGKSGVSSASGCAQNMPRLIPTHIPQPYM